MPHTPEFTIGQTVKAVAVRGLHNITEGKTYTVTGYYEPVTMENGYTFPAYVTVQNDFGKPSQLHTHRFQAVAEVQP